MSLIELTNNAGLTLASIKPNSGSDVPPSTIWGTWPVAAWSKIIICPATSQTCSVNTIILLFLIRSEAPWFRIRHFTLVWIYVRLPETEVPHWPVRKSRPGVPYWTLHPFVFGLKHNASQDSQLMMLIVLHIRFCAEVMFDFPSISEILCLWSHHCRIIIINSGCIVSYSGWIV